MFHVTISCHGVGKKSSESVFSDSLDHESYANTHRSNTNTNTHTTHTEWRDCITICVSVKKKASDAHHAQLSSQSKMVL